MCDVHETRLDDMLDYCQSFGSYYLLCASPKDLKKFPYSRIYIYLFEKQKGKKLYTLVKVTKFQENVYTLPEVMLN